MGTPAATATLVVRAEAKRLAAGQQAEQRPATALGKHRAGRTAAQHPPNSWCKLRSTARPPVSTLSSAPRPSAMSCQKRVSIVNLQWRAKQVAILSRN